MRPLALLQTAAGLAALALAAPAAAQTCGSGTTSTLYAAGLGGNGAFFDVTVGAADMTLECIDVAAITWLPTLDVEVYWCPLTSVGNELNAAAWTLFASATGLTANGAGVATTVDISGNGMVFAAGQSYGLLVVSSNGQTLEYTTGAPTIFTGTHCELTSNAGSFYPFSFAWPDRIFNGALHTELAAPAGPALSVSGTCPGATTLTVANATPGGAVAFAYSYTQGSWLLPGGPACAGTVLPLVQPTLLGTRAADAAGTATFGGNVPAAACGTVSVAALDLATCAPTAALAL